MTITIVILFHLATLPTALNSSVLPKPDEASLMPTYEGTSPVPTTSLMPLTSDEISLVQKTSPLPLTDETSVMPSTEEPSFNCPSGFVKCSSGQCEPFEALCGEGGIVTVIFPTEVTTGKGLTQNSASPIVNGTAIDNHMSTTKTSTTQTIAETDSTTPVTTTPIVVATDANGKEICLDGWEQCMDGTCEPFHWLCAEHGGAFNFTTRLPMQTSLTEIVTQSLVPMSVTEVRTPATSEVTKHPDPVTYGETGMSTGSTGSPGTCPSGFVQCVDGNCEPFEALCGPGGIVTVVFPTDASTTLKRTMSPISGSLATVDSTSGIHTAVQTSAILTTSTTVGTTTPLTVVTDSSGNEVCLDGWEKCTDGTCEPFHWMCTEHDGTAAIIG